MNLNVFDKILSDNFTQIGGVETGVKQEDLDGQYPSFITHYNRVANERNCSNKCINTCEKRLGSTKGTAFSAKTIDTATKEGVNELIEMGMTLDKSMINHFNTYLNDQFINEKGSLRLVR